MTIPARNVCYVALASAVLLAGAGCGGKNKAIKVEGIVTLDGKPVDGATVSFVPEGGNGHPANGLTGSDGVFHLTTFSPGDGAVAGDYKITVTRADSDSADTVVTDTSDPNAMKKIMDQVAKKAKESRGSPKKPPIPATYGDPTKTPLSCKIPTSDKIRLALRSSGGS